MTQRTAEEAGGFLAAGPLGAQAQAVSEHRAMRPTCFLHPPPNPLSHVGASVDRFGHWPPGLQRLSEPGHLPSLGRTLAACREGTPAASGCCESCSELRRLPGTQGALEKRLFSLLAFLGKPCPEGALGGQVIRWQPLIVRHYLLGAGLNILCVLIRLISGPAL